MCILNFRLIIGIVIQKRNENAYQTQIHLKADRHSFPKPTTPHKFHSTSPLPSPPLNLIKQTPILDLKRLPNPRRILNRILNQLSLLANLHIDLLRRILALDMRHINRDQDIRPIMLQPDQREHYRREIRALGAGLRRWRLCGDQRVGWDVLSVRC